MRSAALVYAPVVHRGYVEWITTQVRCGHTVYLLSEEFAKEIDVFRKDLRALQAEEVCALLHPRLPQRSLFVLTRSNVDEVRKLHNHFVFADDDVSAHVISNLFSDSSVDRASVFLRYDRKQSEKKDQVIPDQVIASDPMTKALIGRVLEEGKKSSDWWIQVGAALVRDGELLLLAHNEHVPNPNVVDVLGSVRANYTQGVHIDRSTALHAEGALFAEALRRGVNTNGADLFVSTFPCPYCSPIIAKSGIRRLYFVHGYSMIEGQELLKAHGIEIIRVFI